ncbi:MAG: methyl-accepting chemotaxis protein [Spirochaetota bacterium]
MLRNINLRVKLIISFISVTMLFVILIVINLNNSSSLVNEMNHNIELIQDSKELLQKKIDHLLFRNKVGEFQRNENIIEIKVEKDPTQCGLGKWYYGENRRRLENIIPEIKEDLNQLEKPHTLLHKDVEKIEAFLKKGDRKSAIEYYASEVQLHLSEILSLVDGIVKKVEEKVKSERETLKEDIKFYSSVIIILMIIGVGLSIALSIIISNIIVKPINNVSNNLSTSSDNLEKAANQVASASQELSSGASELASSVEEITSSMEELQSIIESNTKNVNEAEILMKETMQTAKGAQEHSTELQKIMNTIGESSKKIIKINKAIDDIAFQTNILALNAAVEAARAGDVGRGFAVVAEQVKSLAQKSADSARETSDLIDMINQDIESGASKTDIVVTSFNDVVSRAEKVNVLLDEITRASKEQAKGSNQVTKAISQVNSVVQQLAASSEETASSSEEMLSQVESQREAVMELNSVVMGEKAIKNIIVKSADEKKSSDLTSKAHKVHEAIDKMKAKPKEGDKDVELIKPEDKIPLNDFKDF